MITLVLAFHNHQPVGNFGWVIEDAYQRAYRPLMDIIGSHPSIRFGQHYTGILLDWFAENHPDFIEVIRAGVASGRVELLSGGYYEPIMAMLPERDRRRQIEKLNERLRGEFGVHPQGMWLAERVWEPSIPSTLAEVGLGYTLLDDTHFKAAGLRDEDLQGYFLTEDQGKPLAVLPIDKHLRYTIPFEEPESTFDYLRSLDQEGTDRVVVFADDGEKFGIWPDTWRTVYEKGWLERFCTMLDANASWVRTQTASEVISQMKPVGRIYLPTASYAEMLHWALPTPRAVNEFEAFEKTLEKTKLQKRWGNFVRGGFWRNFMVKYPEVNAMQKKMLRLSARLERVRESATMMAPDVEGLLTEADNHLMAAQCNCPYWHGVFGGLYLANIRAAIYREMIAAEVVLDTIERRTTPNLELTDYDFDGEEELIYENREIAFYVGPSRGGSIFEFDYKPLRYNFCDLVQRKPEGYHARLKEVKGDSTHTAAKAASATTSDTTGNSTEDAPRSIHDLVRVKEEGLAEALIYDSYRRASLIDHFFGTKGGAKEVHLGTIRELGDFTTAEYDISVERSKATTTVRLARSGLANRRPIRIEKEIIVADNSSVVRVNYCITSLDGKPLKGRFGVEMAYTLSAGTEPDRYYTIDGVKTTENGGRLNGVGESEGTVCALVDEWLGVVIELRLDREGLFLRSPIETVSLSEDGFERNYQGSVVIPIWELGGTEWRIGFEQRIEPIGHSR